MRLTKDGRLIRTDIWREGTWLDLWSVVHLLTGVSIGVGLPVFHFPAGEAILMTYLGLVAYELWEAVVRIEETPQNRVMDVVVGMMSFLPVYALTSGLGFWERLALFVPVLTLNVALARVGWSASQKAGVFEAQMRLKLQRRRERKALRRAARLAAVQVRHKSKEERSYAPLSNIPQKSS